MEVNDLLLPFDILHNIFIHLELNNAFKLSLINKTFYNIFIKNPSQKYFMFLMIIKYFRVIVLLLFIYRLI